MAEKHYGQTFSVLDLEVMTKLLVAVSFVAESKSAVSHFHYTVKTESFEICTD